MEQKNISTLREQIKTNMGTAFIEKLEQPSNEPFRWNIGSVIFTVLVFANLIMWLAELYAADSYIKFWMLFIASASGYCVYMISLLVGSFLSYRLRRIVGQHFSQEEQSLIYYNLLEAVEKNGVAFPYSSHCVLNDDNNKVRGFVFIVGQPLMDQQNCQDPNFAKVLDIQQKILDLHRVQEINNKCDK